MCDLYNRLSSLCNQMGVSGAKMCRDCGISKSLMSDLKFGRRDTIASDTANRLAKYFGVTVDYILNGEKEKAPTQTGEDLTNEQKELLKLFDSAPASFQEAALALLRQAEAGDTSQDA